jgi:hypothetical protein
MGQNEMAAPTGKRHATLVYTDVPEYLKRVCEQRRRDTGQDQWPSLSPWETAEIQTPEQAWVRLVGVLTPLEWLDLGGPDTLNRIVRYLDPSELRNIRGPYAVRVEAERDRLGILLWRHLILQREATRRR